MFLTHESINTIVRFALQLRSSKTHNFTWYLLLKKLQFQCTTRYFKPRNQRPNNFLRKYVETVFKTVNSNKREDNPVHTSCEKTPHLFLKQRKLRQHRRKDRPHYTLSILRASNTVLLTASTCQYPPQVSECRQAGSPAGRHTLSSARQTLPKQ